MLYPNRLSYRLSYHLENAVREVRRARHRRGRLPVHRPVPLPRVRPGDRRQKADRGDPPVFEGPRNPLISTKTGFDRQAQNGPLFMGRC